MRFLSTRGLAPKTDIRAAALEGLAPDGGLYLPSAWPHFSVEEISSWRGQPYADIAFRVMRPFLEDIFTEEDLRKILQKTYATFDNPDIAPVRRVGDDYMLELFHGPTLAFKDIALQFVGHVFEALLQDSPKKTTVIGATSGDTGSAAIAALATRKNIDVFILYPDKGPSDIQRKQMTCVDAPNVNAIAVNGSFDDCQAIVKTLFSDRKFCARHKLTTVNSINFLRILAQIVYYFVAALRVEGAPNFVVPTGNFGDIFAGYAAMKCGLPVAKLVVASNSNNILTRFFASGTMAAELVKQTLSPSMDIQISSNFERLLFDLCNGKAADVRALMEELKKEKRFTVSQEQLVQARKLFGAGYASDEETLRTIKRIYDDFEYETDPHTAVGIKVAQDLRHVLTGPLVCLATAHPAKFPDTMKKALGFSPRVPPQTAALINKKERILSLPNDAARVAEYIDQKAEA